MGYGDSTKYLRRTQRVQVWIDSNWGLMRGRYISVLPFLSVFPPARFGGHGENWTVHFGWLAWTLGAHFYPRVRESRLSPAMRARLAAAKETRATP
jgi:hypothetical protein